MDDTNNGDQVPAAEAPSVETPTAVPPEEQAVATTAPAPGSVPAAAAPSTNAPPHRNQRPTKVFVDRAKLPLLEKVERLISGEDNPPLPGALRDLKASGTYSVALASLRCKLETNAGLGTFTTEELRILTNI